MTEAEEIVVTRNTRVTVGALGVLVTLFGGTMWQANSIKNTVVRLETTVTGLAKQVERLNDSLNDDAKLLHTHLADPTIHHAKLNSLDGRLDSLERRVDKLEKP